MTSQPSGAFGEVKKAPLVFAAAPAAQPPLFARDGRFSLTLEGYPAVMKTATLMHYLEQAAA